MIARDSLPADATNIRILRRVAAQQRQDSYINEISGALRAIKIEVPSNINVWQHVKGESVLTRAAQTLAESVKVLTDSARR